MSDSSSDAVNFQECEENERKLLDLLAMMDTFEPLIPEELVDFYFTKSGVQCDDPRLKKLVSLIGQKFLADVTADAVRHGRLRASTPGNAPLASRVGATGRGRQPSFTMEDLAFALAERGISIQRPPYHQ